MDPVTIGAAAKAVASTDKMAGAAAEESRWFFRKLFGPMAEVMGEHWADRLRERNLRRLREKTEARQREAEKGGVDPGVANPRVASQVFEAAQYSDQEVVAEYLSGVLASSRDATGKSDNGVAWSGLVSRLSSDQLRLHYQIYASLRPVVIRASIKNMNGLHNRKVLMPLDAVYAQGGFASHAAFSDAIDGLMREGLIGEGYSYGPIATVQASLVTGQSIHYPLNTAMAVNLSVHGVRLFLWGLGAGSLLSEAYLDASLVLQPVDAAEMPPLVAPCGFIEDYGQPPVTSASESGAESGDALNQLGNG